MEHGISWLNFLPGYQQLQHYLEAMNEQVLAAHGGILFGSPLSIQHVLAAGIVTLIVLFLGWRTSADLKSAADGGLVPAPVISVRNIVEVALEALYGQMQQIIGPEARRFLPVIGTLALFIFVANVLGLVPGFVPPTDNWNTTFACSLFVFLYYNWHGLRVAGIGHIVHMANPMGAWWGWFLAPLMFPIELVSHVARPASLGIRLATNMIGDHAVLAAFVGLVPMIVPIPFLFLGLLVCIVQTIVFVLLSTIYISLAVNVAHGHDDEHHDQASEHVAGQERAHAH